jgi:hypothetical protein
MLTVESKGQEKNEGVVSEEGCYAKGLKGDMRGKEVGGAEVFDMSPGRTRPWWVSTRFFVFGLNGIPLKILHPL